MLGLEEGAAQSGLNSVTRVVSLFQILCGGLEGLRAGRMVFGQRTMELRQLLAHLLYPVLFEKSNFDLNP